MGYGFLIYILKKIFMNLSFGHSDKTNIKINYCKKYNNYIFYRFSSTKEKEMI